MGLYEFDAGDARRFAAEFGSGQARVVGQELKFLICPYCHGGPKHDKDTFAINLKTGAFNCKRASCGRSGNMITLHKDFGFSLGSGIDAYYDGMSRFRSFKKAQITIRPKAVEYLESRGISRKVTEMYEITTEAKDDNVLVFPFKDEAGVLWFIKYRKINYNPETDKGGKEWCERDRKPILFGMDHCDPERSRTLVMTEGQIDSLSCTEAGIENAVSVPLGKQGFTWVPHCWNFLCRFRELIVFGDCEHGEITLLKEMRIRFRGGVKHVRIEDYKGCKDANELLQKHGAEAVRQAVANAEMVPVKRLTNLKDVEQVDLDKLEHISTGLQRLDSVIGGFYYGQLILTTGPRGDGKSTVASYFTAHALRQGVPAYIYSGEMPNYIVRAWLDEQLCGMDYRHYDPQSGKYEITKERIEEMQAWGPYSKLWLFDDVWTKQKDDDEEVTDEEERDVVLQTLEEAIVSYGIRFAVIDNLMTAMDFSAGTDLNQAQSLFVKNLAKLAKKYNIIIILVAHPRKGSVLSSKITNDDISGTANITNLCDTVISYARPKKDEEGDRVMTVLKNRMTGRIDATGFPLYFEQRTRRISDTGQFDEKFGWEPDFTRVDPDDDIPF